MADDKREIERVPIVGPVTGEVTVFQRMAILDMTERGAKVEAPSALQNDSLHDFRLSLNNRSVVVKGRIVYCHIGELRNGVVLYRSGVEFVEPSAHALSAIRDFVAVQTGTPARIIDAEIFGEA